MITFLTILYVVVCVFLILVVLLQAGRGGGMGAAFGGSSQTVFGGAGAGNFLTRLTVVMAALFMLLSASLSYLSTSSDKALEKVTKANKLREEARRIDTKNDKTKKGDGKPAPASSEASSTSETTAPPAADEALPSEGVEGAEGVEAAKQPAAAPTPAAPASKPGSNDKAPKPAP